MIVTDLFTNQGREALRDKLVELLRMGDLPTPAWHRFSILRHFTEREPTLLADLWNAIGTVAKGGWLSTARGKWLDLLVQDYFGDARKPAASCEGTVIVEDVASAGPLTITPGSFWVGTSSLSPRRFVATTGGTVALNGSLAITVRAESDGADWNVGNEEIDQILAPASPGFKVSNPGGPEGTWIASQGVDAERDDDLVARMLDKWSLLGAGCDEAAYRYRALSSDPQITRVSVTTPYGGAVRVRVAGPLGPVSASALAAAAALVELKRPIGVPDVRTENCRARPITVQGALYGIGSLADAQAAVTAYARTLPIGAKVSRERIIAACLVSGFDDMELTGPATDIELLSDEAFVPTFSLVAQRP